VSAGLAACGAAGTAGTDSATPTVPPTPESTSAIDHATTKDIYCKALVDLKVPLAGLQNSTMTTSEGCHGSRCSANRIPDGPELRPDPHTR
jgi:hypothetical protein